MLVSIISLGGADMTDTHIQPEPDKSKRLIMLIYLLYVIGLPTVGLASIIGVILAHIKRDEMAEPWRSHATYQIRTFWLTFAIAIVGTILILIGIGILILWLIPIWILVRCIKGFLAANDNRPIDDPTAFI